MATATPPLERYRFTVDDYHRMAEAGILNEDDPVELIEGEIIIMSPIGLRHLACVDRLNTLLAPGLGPRAIVRVQGSVRLSDRSEPEPDVILLRPRPDFYATSPATPADVLWLIEVMDSSASYDRGVKLGLYARSDVAEVWLVDLNEEQVELYRKPLSGRYTEISIRPRGQSVAPEAFPDFVLGVDAILG
jgi:Uma2 family endonuclease